MTTTLRQQLLSLVLALCTTAGLMASVDRLATHYGETSAVPAGWAAGQPSPAPAASRPGARA